MNDTPADIETRFRELILARSPAQRLAMAGRMFATAKALVRAGLLDMHGIIDPVDLRKHLFLRLYGRDFAEPEKARILDCLRAT